MNFLFKITALSHEPNCWDFSFSSWTKFGTFSPLGAYGRHNFHEKSQVWPRYNYRVDQMLNRCRLLGVKNVARSPLYTYWRQVCVTYYEKKGTDNPSVAHYGQICSIHEICIFAEINFPGRISEAFFGSLQWKCSRALRIYITIRVSRPMTNRI